VTPPTHARCPASRTLEILARHSPEKQSNALRFPTGPPGEHKLAPVRAINQHPALACWASRTAASAAGEHQHSLSTNSSGLICLLKVFALIIMQLIPEQPPPRLWAEPSESHERTDLRESPASMDRSSAARRCCTTAAPAPARPRSCCCRGTPIRVRSRRALLAFKEPHALEGQFKLIASIGVELNQVIEPPHRRLDAAHTVTCRRPRLLKRLERELDAVVARQVIQCRQRIRPPKSHATTSTSGCD
jgi:hypothetical protein